MRRSVPGYYLGMPHSTIADRLRELSGWRQIAALAGVLGLAFVVALASVLASSGPTTLSWWWPAVGLGAAAALLASPAQRPYISGVYGVLLVIVSIIGDRGVGIATLGSLSAAIEVFLVATIATGRTGIAEVRNLHGAGRFMLGALVGGVVGATGIAAGAASEGASFFLTIGGVAASHTSAILVITPLFLISREMRVTPWRTTLALTLLTLATTVLAFFPGWKDPLGFLPVPILMYAAFTQSMRVTYAQLLLTISVVSGLTALGGGAFANTSGAIRVTSLLQLYAITLAVTVLFVAAAQANQRALIDQREGARRLLNEGFARARSGFAILSEEAGGALAVLEINPLAMNVLSPELELPSTPGVFVRPDGELRAFARTLAPGRSDTTPWPTDAGEEALFSVTVEALGRSDYGRFYLVYIEDLSALREAEAVMAERLEKSRQVADALRVMNRQKDDFVASVSHELRTPLTSISGYAEELADVVRTPLERDYVEVIRRNSDRLLELVGNVLAAARRRQSDVEAAVVPVVLREAIEQCLLDVRYSVVSRGIDVAVDCVPSLIVTAYASDLGRVISNLISNAVKFSPQGGAITIRASRTEEAVVLSVEDQGPGIDPDERERLFEPFYRAARSISEGVAGTGLGLAITRDLLVGMNATISLDNAPSGGAIAEVRFLPAAVVEEKPFAVR